MLNFHDLMIDSDLGSLNRRPQAYVLDASTSSLPAVLGSPATSITADGVNVGLGSRILYTALSTASENNMFYEVVGTPTALYLVLKTDGINPSGAPEIGDFCFVQAGTHSSMIYGWNGDAWQRCDFQALAEQTLAQTGLNMAGAMISEATVPLRVALTTPVTTTLADSVVITNLTVAGAVAVSLPASPLTGELLTIKDGKGDAGTNHITITPAAGDIDGASTLVLSSNYASARLVYNGTQWNQI